MGDELSLELDETQLPQGFILPRAQLAPPQSGSFQDLGWELSVEAGKLRASPLRAGSLKLPSLTLKDPESGAEVKTEELEFQIRSVLDSADPQSSQPAPIRPPWSARFPWLPVLGIGAGVLALAALLIWGLLRLVRRKKPAGLIQQTMAPALPEDALALEALEALEKKWEGSPQAWHKPAYFGASEILKKYLAARYRFDALESTSGEILSALALLPQSPPEEEKRLLMGLLHELDRVKFTDQHPEWVQFKELIALMRKWVAKTRRPLALEPILNGSSSHAP